MKKAVVYLAGILLGMSICMPVLAQEETGGTMADTEAVSKETQNETETRAGIEGQMDDKEIQEILERREREKTNWIEYTDSENEQILKQERDALKKYGGQIKAITEEMYAALYGLDDGSIDAKTDIILAANYFSKMGYGIEAFDGDPYIPTYYDIDRRYFCTDILVYSGYAFYDKLYIRPEPSKRNSENNTGVYMGERSLTEGSARHVGIGKRGMPTCRFVMFAGCETANPNYTMNLAKYAVLHGAASSIGWQVKVHSQSLHSWETAFFSELFNGRTLNQAKENTDSRFRSAVDPSVLQSQIYGNGNIVLSKAPKRSVIEEEDGFLYIKEPLAIDCANNDVEALTNYLAEYAEGFDRETCEIEFISQGGPGEKDYTILYELKYHGFDTLYRLMVITSEDSIKYVSDLDKFQPEYAARSVTMYSDDIADEVVEQAKKEAVGDGYEGSTVIEQNVTKYLNEDLRPFLYIQTVYEEEAGGLFADGYEYYLE